MNPLIALLIEEFPAILARIRELFAKDNPDAVPPTDQEIIDAYNAAYASSLAKDDAWRAAHPE